MTAHASTSQAHLYNGNLDYNVSDKDRLAFRYFYQNAPNTNPHGSGSINGFPKVLEAGSF